jgi:hypothetical protein
MKYGFITILALSVFAGCNSNTDVQYKQASDAPELSDSTCLFNGRSLDGWEITNFGPQGPVTVSGGNIVLGMGEGCTGITYKKDLPGNNYQICLDAKRVAGVDFFCGLTFPVDRYHCTLIIGGWGGTTVGLSSIDGRDASENETTRFIKFRTDQWYGICLEVKGDSIKGWIDDSLVVDFNRSGRELSIRPEVELSKPLGICSWNTTAYLRNIRIVALD